MFLVPIGILLNLNKLKILFLVPILFCIKNIGPLSNKYMQMIIKKKLEKEKLMLLKKE